jgi:hypothetical protein
MNSLKGRIIEVLKDSKPHITNELAYPTTFPRWLKQAIEEVLSEHTWFSDPERCADLCGIASEELMLVIKANMPEGTAAKLTGDYWHQFVQVDNWFIDLTARQFDSNASCPKIWTDPNENTWYHPILEKQLPYFTEINNKQNGIH